MSHLIVLNAKTSNEAINMRFRDIDGQRLENSSGNVIVHNMLSYLVQLVVTIIYSTLQESTKIVDNDDSADTHGRTTICFMYSNILRKRSKRDASKIGVENEARS